MLACVGMTLFPNLDVKKMRIFCMQESSVHVCIGRLARSNMDVFIHVLYDLNLPFDNVCLVNCVFFPNGAEVSS